MRSYKTKYDIPLFNWIMLTEKGFDLSYLKKNGKVKQREKVKLNDIYINILDSLDGANFKTLELYNDWQELLTKYRAELLRKKGNAAFNIEYDINIQGIERVFREYLEVLEKDYTGFEFTQYYFNPDYKNLFKEFAKDAPKESYDLVLKELFKFKNAQFYDWNQYYMLCNQFPEIMVLTLSEAFKKVFILERKIKVGSLVKLDIALEDIFSSNKMYDNYQFVRGRLFDLNNLNSEKKEDVSGFTEVSRISQILERTINTKSITLAEYESEKETAIKIVEQRKVKQ